MVKWMLLSVLFLDNFLSSHIFICVDVTIWTRRIAAISDTLVVFCDIFLFLASAQSLVVDFIIYALYILVNFTNVDNIVPSVPMVSSTTYTWNFYAIVRFIQVYMCLAAWRFVFCWKPPIFSTASLFLCVWRCFHWWLYGWCLSCWGCLSCWDHFNIGKVLNRVKFWIG